MTTEYTERQREKDLRITKYVESYRIDLNNPYDNIEEKMNLLEKICGWKNLRVGANGLGNAFLPIRKCKDGRITSVAKKVYGDAKKRLIKYKKPKEAQYKLRFEE